MSHANYKQKGCSGCRYRLKDGRCDFAHLAGASRLKLGSLMYPGGGCAQYARKPRNRESKKN